VVTPCHATLEPWISQSASNDGRISKEIADSVFDEFAAWLRSEIQCASEPDQTSLAKRCVAIIAATEGFNFALSHDFPPMFPQSRFVLVVSCSLQVRVAWVAFATDEARPDLESTPFLLRLLTADLNSTAAAADAAESGVEMEYAVATTSIEDIDRYIRERETASLSRAAVEDFWDDFMAARPARWL